MAAASMPPRAASCHLFPQLGELLHGAVHSMFVRTAQHLQQEQALHLNLPETKEAQVCVERSLTLCLHPQELCLRSARSQVHLRLGLLLHLVPHITFLHTPTQGFILESPLFTQAFP